MTFYDSKSKYLTTSAYTYIFIVFLYALGIIYWAWFFNFGSIQFSVFDWDKEYSYYKILKQSLQTLTIPYHFSQKFQGTFRFLSIPETNLSPLILLLPFFNIGTFILLNTVIMYSVGFVGTIFIMRKYGLSLIQFTFLFLLINFNGHIISHLSAGHSMWSGYFLLPWLVYFIFQMLETKQNNTPSVKIALVLFGMLLLGAVHFFIWSCMFLLLIALFNLKYLNRIFQSIALSALLGIFRLVPALNTFVNTKNIYTQGINSVRDFVNAFISSEPVNAFKMIGPIKNYWLEYDIYIGVVGVLLIAVFGICMRFKQSLFTEDYSFRKLDFALLIMFLLSLEFISKIVFQLPVPFISAVRLPTRLLIIPVVVLIVISCIRLQKLMERYPSDLLKILTLIGVLLLAYNLEQHSLTLRNVTGGNYNDAGIANLKVSMITASDYYYKNLELITIASSLITSCVLIYYWLNKRLSFKNIKASI